MKSYNCTNHTRLHSYSWLKYRRLFEKASRLLNASAAYNCVQLQYTVQHWTVTVLVINPPSYPPDYHQSSDDICCRGEGWEQIVLSKQFRVMSLMWHYFACLWESNASRLTDISHDMTYFSTFHAEREVHLCQSLSTHRQSGPVACFSQVTLPCAQLQDSWAIAKKTARCAQYMGTLKIFESSLRTQLLIRKFVMDFCSDRY